MSKGLTRNFASLIVILSSLMIIASCSSDHTYFHQYHPVDPDGWMSGDTIVFALSPSSCQQTLKAEIGVRTTDAFQYNTLYLLGALHCEDELISTDTLAIDIYKANGLPIGDGFPYPTCTCTIQSISVDSGLNYTYTVTPYMTPELVKGVKDIGIKFTVEQ